MIYVDNFEMKELKSFADLVDDLRKGSVAQHEWQDVDDFFHGASVFKVIRETGRLCAHLAHIYPGKISGMYSEEAVPWLESISNYMRGDKRLLEAELHNIWCKLNSANGPYTPHHE
jgi:hypothetical protein